MALVLNRIGLDKVLEGKTLTPEPSFTPPEPLMDSSPKPGAEYSVGSDVKSDYWAYAYIDRALRLGLVENYPDGQFKPDEKISRGVFALMLQTVLVRALDDESLSKKYLGTESQFNDITSSHWAYNAAVVSVNRGLLKAKGDGAFGIMDGVTGAEGLLAVRKLREEFGK